MARRPSRHGAPRRRWAVFSLAALAVLATLGWLAPTVLVLTELRDRPLEAALAGIDGSVTSGSARWGWLRGIEYHDVVLRGRDGRPALIVPLVVVERGLLALALDPHALGTVRLVGPEALVEVRRGGSSLEDILAPWLAATGQSQAAAGRAAGTSLTCDLEVVDAVVEFTDLEAGEAWRVADLIAAAGLDRSGAVTGWTVAGRLRHAGRRAGGQAAPDGAPAGVSPAPPPAAPRLDRTTIPAAAAAMLAREGGWSVSAAGGPDPRSVTIAAHRLPLGASSILATRFALDHVVDGLADVRLDGSLHAAGADLRGSLALARLAVCTAGTLVERAAIERVEVPLDLSIAGRQVTVRSLAATAPMIALQAAGRFELPQGDLWAWADGLAAGDFAATAEVDLAAAARALPAGIAVRPDVRLTGGRLEIGAAARPDGTLRLLEVRVAARDLEAEQRVAPAADGGDAPAPAAAAGTRSLAWREPFTAWLRGRRGPGAGDRLQLEELRISAAGTEITATGAAGDLELQWTAELGTLAAAAGELVDLGGTTVAGRSSGRVGLARGTAGTTAVKLAASATDLVVERPGRPAWRDEELVVEADAEIAVTAGVTTVSHARALVAAGADRLEARCTGGVLVDGAAGVPRLRPATAEPVAAECSIAGELSRWQARLAALVPAARVGGLEVAGRVAAGVAVTSRVTEDGGEAWQITRAGGEIEKLAGRWGTRRLAEPRIVCTAAGTLFPARGRVDLTALELLSATVSLRSGGLSWLPARAGADSTWERVRGRLQWQADVGRLAGWLEPVAGAAPPPAAGRAWGTIDLVDVPAGTNLLVEATGSQLSVAAPKPAGAPWTEPRATLALELTRPGAGAGDRLRIDRLAIGSSTLTLAAAGTVEDWSARRLLRLDGTATYDWEQVSRLLAPWTGGRVRLAGTGDRPFTLRAALGRSPAAVAAPGPAAPEPAALPLPADWLAATRRGDGAAARVARPVAARSGRDERLQSLAVDTSAAWSAAEIDGVRIAAGEMAVRLLEGQLSLGPFDVAAAGGRLRGAPWVRLEPWPGELVVPPGRVVERVALEAAACDRWVTWLSPVLGHSTHTAGLVTVDLAGARLPLADPFAGELAGQVVFERLEVTPRQALAPLVNLLVRLQSAVDPRFAVGDKAVLLRVRPDPVRVRLAGGRLAHEGLVMDAGQLTLRSAGSVGVDGSLAMTVEVALRADVLGTTPVLATLVRTPLVIPLKGTVQRPQFDAGAIDLVLGRIIENTAQAVINDGLGRGLETLFGNPQPQPPLTLPPRP